LYAQDANSGSILIQSNVEEATDPLMIVTMKVAGTGGGTDQQKVDQLIEMIWR
jgi:hypothetical protein